MKSTLEIEFTHIGNFHDECTGVIHIISNFLVVVETYRCENIHTFHPMGPEFKAAICLDQGPVDYVKSTFITGRDLNHVLDQWLYFISRVPASSMIKDGQNNIYKVIKPIINKHYKFANQVSQVSQVSNEFERSENDSFSS